MTCNRVVALILGVVLHRSVLGRCRFAGGKNEEAARYSGISTKLVIAGAHVPSGLLAGGLLLQQATGLQNLGDLDDLSGILHQLGLALDARQFL
jgi:ribose/xylose/arabinose/galactoside ABC-type transport system permease subunit